MTEECTYYELELKPISPSILYVTTRSLIVNIVENCPKLSTSLKIVKKFKIVKTLKNCQNSQKLSKSCQNSQKIANIVNIVENFEMLEIVKNNCQNVGQFMSPHH